MTSKGQWLIGIEHGLRNFLRIQRGLLYVAFAACAGIWISTPDAGAQATGAGIISGTVTDSSGAVIVGAKLIVTNAATDVHNPSATNSTG